MTDNQQDFDKSIGNDEEELKEDELLVLTEPDATPMGGDFRTSVPISANKINKNLKAFTGKFSEVMKDVQSLGRYELSEVSINVGITASGQIQLIGVARGKTQVAGGVTLKFTKPFLREGSEQ